MKAHWDTVKHEVISFVKEFEGSGRMVKRANTTFITLIPKVSDPLTLSDYRPISLVGCQYKIITKLLAERMKGVMPDLIFDNQTALVGGRQILDGELGQRRK